MNLFEAALCGAVELYSIIQEGVFNIFSTKFISTRVLNIRNTSHYNTIQQHHKVQPPK